MNWTADRTVIRRNVQVVNKLGLHARAATKLVKEAAGYECEILLCKDGQREDAKSIMGIMMLAAGEGVELEIIVDGADEQMALNSIIELFNSRFGEAE